MKPKLKRKRPAPGRISALTGVELQAMIDKAGLTQRGLGKILGINERTMRFYLSGAKPIPVKVDYSTRWAIHVGLTEPAQPVSHKGPKR